MLGLVRVLSNVPVVDDKPLACDEAFKIYLEWIAEPEVQIVAEPERCHEILAGFVKRSLVTKTKWTDAYLAAVAIAGGYRLVSFDRDFSRFPGLDWLHLR